jgi:hypothetical protein
LFDRVFAARRTTTGTTLRAAGAGLAALSLVVAILPATLADSAQAAKKPKKTPMPAALQPGKWTKPVWPERSVPAYFTPSGVQARVSAGSAGPDARYTIPTPAGSTSVWGDWDNNGSTSPAVFTNGVWQVYDRIIGAAPKPTRVLAFGAAGDRPVAGDWNGDGITDIGFVRGNVWTLSIGTTPIGPDTTVQQTIWRQFVYGLATDRLVVGDWDGDRVDGIGVVRGTRWYLRQRANAGKPAIGFTYGVRKTKGKSKKVKITLKPSDTPVVGDWNGDKSDTVGVVRASTWYLRDKNNGGKPTQTRTVSKPGRSVAAPWRTVAGPVGAACPTAGRKVLARGKTVVPSKLLDKAVPYTNAATDPAFQVRRALWQAERYLTGAQYDERWAARRWQPFTDIRGKQADEEFAIRRPAMAALTAAIAVGTSGHSDKMVGRKKSEVIAYADWLVRSIACEHASVTPGGWGSGWQTAHWATLTGEAAWLIWDHLTPQTRDYVASMIISEANFRIGQPTGYWTDKQGNVLPGFEGNTRAEDDSWNSTLLQLAVDMMPKAYFAKAYQAKAIDLMTASYSTRADMTSATTVNGVPLSSRLQGSNALDDGTVINHSRIHPDYATNIQHLWWAADIAGLAKRSVPEAAFHNAGLVYDSLSTLAFTAGAASPAGGAYLPPGGTSYTLSSNDIYYPQGSDWGTIRRAHFVSFDAHALAYGLASPGAWSPREAMSYHVAGQLALIRRGGVADGRTYSADEAVAATEDTYDGREEYAASQIATAWLALYVGHNGHLKIDRANHAPPTAFKASGSWRGWRQPGATSSQKERLSP